MNLTTMLSAVIDVALVDGELSYASVTLPDLRVTFDGEAQDGSVRTMVVKNDAPIRIGFDGPTSVITVGSFHLGGDAGTIAVAGFVGPNDSKASVKAILDLSIVQFLARSGLQSSHGSLLVDAEMSGPMAAPKIGAVVDFKGTELRPQGFAEAILIPTGRLEVTNRQDGKAEANLRQLRVQVAGGDLLLAGRVGLGNDWKPKEIRGGLAGELPAKIAEIAAPAAVAEPSGSLGLLANVSGTAQAPIIDGSIMIPLTGIELTVRKLAQIKLLGGKINFDQTRVGIDNIRAKIDEGTLSLNGAIDLKEKFKVDNIDLKIRGREIPYRLPGTLFISVSPRIDIGGDLTGLTVGGKVDIVECEVTQQVDLGKFLQRKTVSTTGDATGPKRRQKGPVAPNPIVVNTELDIEIASPGGISVRNNLADLKLDAALKIGGSPVEPEIAGQVRFMGGGFKVPFWQGRFDRTSGAITFYPGRELGVDSPEFNIRSENDLIDAADVQHLVLMVVTGTPEKPIIDLSTQNTGLNFAQTITLLTTKRAPTELRNELKGAQQGGGGTAVADSAVKDLMSAPLNDLLGPAAQSLMKTLLFGFTADVNFAIGPESAEMVIKKKFNRYLSARGRIVLGLIGKGRQEARGDLKLHDDLGFLTLFERRAQGDGTEDEAKSVLKLQLLFQHKFLK
jgi:hypothetical protein